MTQPTSRIDLRSDTVTRPSPRMREAMASAEVGDDNFDEDPTVRALEEKVASLLGKEAALFVPTGTMSNQIALMLHCRQGDEVFLSEATHCMTSEAGAAAAWAGVQGKFVGPPGTYTGEQLEAALGPGYYFMPRPRLAVIENTHGAAGGIVWTAEQERNVAEVARSHGLAVHLDGARLWNASVATGESLTELAAPADTVTVCFSKALGAPVGSAFVGEREAIVEARRVRKMLGGGMRQAGVLAAPAMIALENISALARDHEKAKTLYEGLRELDLKIAPPETNIVQFELPEPLEAPSVVERAAKLGVDFLATGRRRIRLIPHCDVSGPDLVRALAVIHDVIAAP